MAKGSEAKAGKLGRSAKAASNDDDEDALKASIDGITQGARVTPAPWRVAQRGLSGPPELPPTGNAARPAAKPCSSASIRSSMRRPNDPLRRRG